MKFALAICYILYFLCYGALPAPLPQAFAGQSSPVQQHSPQQPDIQAKIVRVVDGDSLLVHIPEYPPIIGYNITVRVVGCDTPERKDKNPQIRAKAEEAKVFVQSILPAGSVVWLREIQRDKYFRLLARVEAKGKDLTTLLLEKGLAKPYSGGKKEAFTAHP